jgi:predicted DsbA family dithiol-disulfide isomerase
MKVDIWSDIRCPFCYIGKRKFEMALQEFDQKNEVEVIWHSFELDPQAQTMPNGDMYDHLAKVKGQTREWSIKMHEHVTNLAKEVGLDYDFDKAIIANSFNAHRLIQFAKTKNLGDVAKERLLKAYFTEGKNIDDKKTLIDLGIEIGLNKIEVEQVINSDAFTKNVRDDEEQARQIGVTGVPFFVFDQKFAVSGAQDPKVFLDTLQKVWNEKEKI